VITLIINFLVKTSTIIFRLILKMVEITEFASGLGKRHARENEKEQENVEDEVYETNALKR